MKAIAAVALTALGLCGQSLAANSEQQFLEFPLATQTVAASNGTAFAWLIRQGGRTQVRYARAPKFEAQTLASVEDGDGQPPTDVALSPDGQFVAFATGNAFGGEQSYNPMSLLAPAGPAVWVTTPRSEDHGPELTDRRTAPPRGAGRARTRAAARSWWTVRRAQPRAPLSASADIPSRGRSDRKG